MGDEGLGGPASLRQASALLIGAGRAARASARLAVDGVAVKAQCGEPRLHIFDIGGGDLHNRVPPALEAAAAPDAIREIANEQGIKVRPVIFPDRLEVLEGQES